MTAKGTIFIPPTEEDIKRVHKNLGTDPATIKAAMDALLDWLRQQPHLPDTIDHRQLERIFINCKCSMERSKKALDSYFTLKTRLPEILQNRDLNSAQLQRAMVDTNYFPMPVLTPEGYRVVVGADFLEDGSSLDGIGYQKLVCMMMEVRLLEDYSLGDVHVVNFDSFRASHLAVFTITWVRRMEMCLKTAYSSRIKGIHFINAPAIIETFMKTITLALSQKLRSRLHVHTKASKSLFDFVPRECIPDDLGGTGGPVAELWSNWKKMLFKYEKWFLEQDTNVSDESKRPETNKYNDLFGIDGSFRKLTVD